MAIKKVLQDKRFKNRELQIMQLLEHCNVIKHKHCFYSTTAEHEVRLLSHWKERAAGTRAAVEKRRYDSLMAHAHHASPTPQSPTPSLYRSFRLAKAEASFLWAGLWERDRCT